jgi:hypothetical protein
MASIVPYLRDASFDPDAIRIMSLAYDEARRSLHDRGQPEVVLELIATRIIAFASKGERDPEKLVSAALQLLGTDESKR